MTEIFHTKPPVPAINGEPYYDGMEDAAPGSELAALYCRSAMYGSVLSGGLGGHIYGAGGWQGGLWSADIEDGSRDFLWDAFRWTSAAQMQHLATFVRSEGRRYQDLVPADDRLFPRRTGKPKGLTGWAYCARTPEDDLFLIYFEKDCPRATLSGLKPRASYRAEWFDPRGGCWRAPTVPLEVDPEGAASLPAFPSGTPKAATDWALKVSRG